LYNGLKKNGKQGNMIKWIKFIGSVVIDEICMKSRYKGPAGSDTLLRCFLATAFFVGFYFLIYYFPYEKPEPRKVEWHRLVAGVMCSAGIFVAVAEYSIWLYRRTKARLHQHSLTLPGMSNQD